MQTLSRRATSRFAAPAVTQRLQKRHTAQLAGAKTQLQGDHHPRCICQNSHVFQKNTQRGSLIQKTTPQCDPSHTLHPSTTVTSSKEDIPRNALMQTLSHKASSAYAASAVTQASSDETHSVIRRCKHSAAGRSPSALHLQHSTIFQKTTAKLADPNTQPQSDIQVRRIRSNPNIFRRGTQRNPPVQTLSHKATTTCGASAATHTSSRKTPT